MTNPANHDASVDREPTAIERAALGWVVRCDRGGLSAAEERELAAWLAADTRHQELFEEFGGVWTVMGEASAETATARAKGAEGGRRRFEGEDRRTARRRKIVPFWLSLAAAAAIVMAVAPWRRAETPAADAAVRTAVGASRQLTLSDGSRIELNTDSAVVPAFVPDVRRVRLERGEAFFKVAKDASRPFIVEAAGVGVRAVGTAFNVRVQAAAIEVLVTEGKVRVAPTQGGAQEAFQPVEVAAGQRVIVPLGGGARTSGGATAVASDEMQRRLAWQEGRLDFSDTSLGEMVAEFNRYNRHQLAVPEAELAAMRFGGAFRPDDWVGFVRVLKENFGVVADERGEQTILRAGASGKN